MRKRLRRIEAIEQQLAGIMSPMGPESIGRAAIGRLSLEQLNLIESVYADGLDARPRREWSPEQLGVFQAYDDYWKEACLEVGWSSVAAFRKIYPAGDDWWAKR
jgi:hypothetical protein